MCAKVATHLALGWPGFYMTQHQFNTVIYETIQDYAIARRYIHDYAAW